jgi:arylformamidase
VLIDISRPIAPGALVYPGDPPVAIEPLCRLASGDAFNLSQLRFASHTLTHLDAPRHFFDDGAAVDELPPERFLGEALVVAVEGPVILPEHVPEEPRGLNILFRTRHSGPWSGLFDSSHVYVSADAARRMADGGANLVGIDYLSIDRAGDEDYPAHRALLGAGVLVLEGLDLAAAAPGRYRLIALPLRLAGGDGSPVRAVLLSPSR